MKISWGGTSLLATSTDYVKILFSLRSRLRSGRLRSKRSRDDLCNLQRALPSSHEGECSHCTFVYDSSSAIIVAGEAVSLYYVSTLYVPKRLERVRETQERIYTKSNQIQRFNDISSRLQWNIKELQKTDRKEI